MQASQKLVKGNRIPQPKENASEAMSALLFILANSSTTVQNAQGDTEESDNVRMPRIPWDSHVVTQGQQVANSALFATINAFYHATCILASQVSIHHGRSANTGISLEPKPHAQASGAVPFFLHGFDAPAIH